MKFEISGHAQEEIGRIEISESVVDTILQNPEQIVIEYGKAELLFPWRYWTHQSGWKTPAR